MLALALLGLLAAGGGPASCGGGPPCPPVQKRPGAADARTYEDARLAAVLAAEGLVPFVPGPADRIGFVRIVRHDVFTPDDPWPDVFNVVHVMTAEDVVARELLFDVGDPYAHLEESARNLRDMFVFSLVRVVPVRRGAEIGVLVFTRDLWSLRFEQGFQLTGGSIDRLLLQMTERNVAGRAKVASARFTLDPSAWSLGETYIDPRLWGGDLSASERLDVFFSRQTGVPDGVVTAALFGKPLLSLAQPWGFELSGSLDARVIRQIQGGAVIPWDAPSTPEVESVPRVFGQQQIDLEAAVKRQFTAVLVHRFSLGLGYSDDAVAPVAETALPEALAAEFARDVLPRTRRTLFPFVTWQAFSARHRIYEDLDTYGVSEAVRIGPSLTVATGAGSRGALSSSDTIFINAAAGMTLDPFDGLLEAAFEAGARYEDGVVKNRLLAARLRYASAPVLLGRLVLRADGAFRRFDETNALVSLGGDSGLRGYPSQAFYDFGADLMQTTVEWRSLPVDILSMQLGVAAFYDAGAVFQELSDAQAHHSIGVGLRFLFPQLNRGVYRLDFAAPLDTPGFSVLFSIGDAQAVEHARPAFDRLVPRR